jgi:hypothetical protein
MSTDLMSLHPLETNCVLSGREMVEAGLETVGDLEQRAYILGIQCILKDCCAVAYPGIFFFGWWGDSARNFFFRVGEFNKLSYGQSIEKGDLGAVAP